MLDPFQPAGPGSEGWLHTPAGRAAAGELLAVWAAAEMAPGTAVVVCGADGLPAAAHGASAGIPAVAAALRERRPIVRDGGCGAPVLVGELLLGAVGIAFPPGMPGAPFLGMAAAGIHALALRAEAAASAEALVYNRAVQELVETISDGFMAIDREGRVSYLNRSGAEILGLDVAQSMGRKLTDLVDFHPQVLSVLDTGRGWVDREFFIRVGAKGPIHLVKSAIPVLSPAGEVTGVIDPFREIRKVRQLVTEMVGARASFTFEEIIGQSDAMRQLVATARRVAATESTVLLQGESGTGKELFAQAIHNASRRAAGPFITIDCAAIPRELVESELFGSVEGAFTGARKGGRPGKFELAHGGTVFLDEIGEMPLEMQAKLLRVLQSRKVVRVGGSDPIPVDIRVIAATNRNLADEVRQRNFREDLFFRLNVLPLAITPLRKRKEDSLLLLEHFLRIGRPRHGKPELQYSPESLEMLCAYDWPGNVRELENVVERALTLATGPLVEPGDLPAAFPGQQAPGGSRRRCASPGITWSRPPGSWASPGVPSTRNWSATACGEARCPDSAQCPEFGLLFRRCCAKIGHFRCQISWHDSCCLYRSRAIAKGGAVRVQPNADYRSERAAGGSRSVGRSCR